MMQGNHVEIIATKHFCFFERDGKGQVERTIVVAGSPERVPSAVADLAIARGAAALPGTAEGAAALCYTGPVNGITIAHCINLGDPLGVLEAN